jgi:RNA polymerase sigma factor (sigma-70 family)
VSSIEQGEKSAMRTAVSEAARKRAAIETYSQHEDALRRTARRYSLCADDADDALQRALEILLLKAPSEDPRELIRWTQTVVKHEALAVKRDRERILSGPAAVVPEPGREDWVAMIPARADGPPERAERQEAVARSREALQALKPQELRALSLLAEGYSYREIGEITGFSQTNLSCISAAIKFGGRSPYDCDDLEPSLNDSGPISPKTAASASFMSRSCTHSGGGSMSGRSSTTSIPRVQTLSARTPAV